MSNNEANNHTVPSKFAHKNTGIPVAVEKKSHRCQTADWRQN